MTERPDLNRLRGDWSYPTAIRFGPGRIEELPAACAALGITRPLLVTDPGLAGHALGERVLGLARAGLPTGLFADIRPNPTGADVTAGVEAFRAGSHDGVIALGGGSALDAAKAIAFMVPQERPIWDFEDRGDNWRRAIAEGLAPVVAVPTTAGTGSEVGRAAVISNQDTHHKAIIFHPQMMPGQVIADPELTLGLPPNLTAWTGIDALSHSLEALCAPGFHPMADGIATEAIRLIKRWLPRAVEDGQDLAARASMLAAASMGAIAFQKGLGAMHAMAHPIGGLLDRHHGLTIAIVMPYVLVANRPAIEQPMARLASILGLPQADFDGLLGWVMELRSDLEIPSDLGALGVGEEHLEVLAPRAAADPSAGGNPLPLDPSGYEDLYRRAMRGALLAAP
ncbi:MAG: iron-containing alcohol dehydrogenase [Pseudomonadota bacterium]